MPASVVSNDGPPPLPPGATVCEGYVAVKCQFCGRWSCMMCPFKLLGVDYQTWHPFLPWGDGTKDAPAGLTCRICTNEALLCTSALNFSLLPSSSHHFSHFVYMKQGGPSHGFMSTIAKLLLIRIVSQSKVHRAGGWQEDVGNIRKPLALNRLVAKVSPQHCLSIFENIILMWLTCLAHIALNDAFATSCRCKALMLRDPNQPHLRLVRDT